MNPWVIGIIVLLVTGGVVGGIVAAVISKKDKKHQEKAAPANNTTTTSTTTTTTTPSTNNTANNIIATPSNNNTANNVIATPSTNNTTTTTPTTYEEKQGFYIGAGSNVAGNHAGFMSLAEAKDLCSSLPTCKGFTAQKSNDSDASDVYYVFKTNNNVFPQEGNSRWVSYCRNKCTVN